MFHITTPQTRPPPALIAEAVRKRLPVWSCLSSAQVLTDFSRSWTPALIFARLSCAWKSLKVVVCFLNTKLWPVHGMQRPGTVKLVSMTLFSQSFCASVSLMFWAWNFYSIQWDIRVPPTPDSNSGNARRERTERVKEVEREYMRWDGTELSVHPFVFLFPYLQYSPEPIKLYT